MLLLNILAVLIVIGKRPNDGVTESTERTHGYGPARCLWSEPRCTAAWKVWFYGVSQSRVTRANSTRGQSAATRGKTASLSEPGRRQRGRDLLRQ